MEDTLIEYKTAILAKEKGFTWKCKNYFDTEISSNRINTWYDKEGFKNTLSKNSNKFCTRPSQSLLCKWLRDVHNIHFNVDCSHYEGLHWEVGEIFDFKDQVILKQPFKERFDTFEEAMEFGLFNALKLINNEK